MQAPVLVQGLCWSWVTADEFQPVPRFLHVNQMMASHRELGQSSTDLGMDEEWGGRVRSNKSLWDMGCPGPISHLLVTGDTYLLLNRLQTPTLKGRAAFWDL